MTDSIEASIYDFPKYYDLLFGSDWRAEFDFLQGCFELYGRTPVARVFEPACGTGRLLIKLAQAGYAVSGNDLNPLAVRYCNERLERHGFGRPVHVGDMADFRLSPPADAAFNTINSFRHLPTEQTARDHLRCVADSLVPGGLYILGIHLLPAGGPRLGDESWSARRGNLVVNSYMWSIEIDQRARMEHLGMTVDVYTPTRHLRIMDRMEYRTYTLRQFRALLRQVPDLEVAGVHDFAYNLAEETILDGLAEDVVVVLRRK